MPSGANVRQVFEELETRGILLESDAALPSVVSLVAGDPIRGSWWGHPRGHDIHDVAESLGEHPDVIVTKLISGKVTYLHRSLWPAIVVIGLAHEPWQIEKLGAKAQQMLAKLSRDDELRTDEIPWTGGAKKDSPGEAARQLERRLLVYSEEVHTESGAHAKRLESWERWAKRVGLASSTMSPAQAKKMLEDVLTALNQQFKAKGRLPWQGI